MATEQLAHHARGLADVLLDQRRRHCLDERRLHRRRQRLREQRLPRARRTVQQNALRRLDPHALEELGFCKRKLDDLA